MSRRHVHVTDHIVALTAIAVVCAVVYGIGLGRLLGGAS